MTVRTRPPEEQSSDAAVERVRGLDQELRAAGCQVELRERMHEKVLVLDATVLWHGSLNLLANLGPTDLMMRLTDPAACKPVGRVIAHARNLNVPYAETDEPKRLLGARWDSGCRPWYVDANRVSRDEASRWLPNRRDRDDDS
ncbi:DUF5710 domain-containing protein [Streptomyces antibioticus]|uniref:DUF5710 domain-containing protein n=1 Tax=Streptomyces antibioticus TaxID=1890 RepID=UPI0036C9F079